MKLIPKYQNAGLVTRQDNTYVAKPTIPPKLIKRTYTPTQSYVSQDNRSGWQREESKRYKEQQDKNNNLYKSQHLWNWSAPFNNTRTTNSNANAMFYFNKSAGMNTFAVGMGIANPTVTATSLAGSLIGAGVGNKVAGDKGALVGGLVGGMVNPKSWIGKKGSSNTHSAILKPKLTPEELAGIPKGERKSPTPYRQIGTVEEISEDYMKPIGNIFGPFIAKHSEQAVFNHATDPTKVVKVYAVNDKGFPDITAIKKFQMHFMKRNQIPFGIKNRFSGYLKGKEGIFPVYVQDKVTPLRAMNNTQYEKEILPKLAEQLKAEDYIQISPDVFSNGKFKITDLYPENMGYDNQGNLIFFDAKAYRFGGLLGRRHRL